MKTATYLKKKGWEKEIINNKEWFIEPASGKHYRLSHALVVQDELEHQQEIEDIRLIQEQDSLKISFYAIQNMADKNIDKVWPKVNKAHGRLRYCTNRLGCVYHNQLVWCGRHFHFRRYGLDAVKCPKEKRCE